jgi:hypothetical protein
MDESKGSTGLLPIHRTQCDIEKLPHRVGDRLSNRSSNPSRQDFDHSFDGVPNQVHQPDTGTGILQKHDSGPEIVEVFLFHPVSFMAEDFNSTA